MKKQIGAISVALITLLSAPFAEAIFLSIAPSSVTVSAGGSISVDVTISGLGSGVPPSVGAFDLDLSYNAAVLNPVGVSFGPFLGNPLLFEALTDFSFSVPGIVDFAEVSLLSSSALDALQPSSFRLATLSFVGIGSGTSLFALVGDIRVDDAFGNKLLIPEPATVLLLSVGLLGLLCLTMTKR